MFIWRAEPIFIGNTSVYVIVCTDKVSYLTTTTGIYVSALVHEETNCYKLKTKLLADLAPFWLNVVTSVSSYLSALLNTVESHYLL